MYWNGQNFNAYLYLGKNSWWLVWPFKNKKGESGWLGSKLSRLIFWSLWSYSYKHHCSVLKWTQSLIKYIALFINSLFRSTAGFDQTLYLGMFAYVSFSISLFNSFFKLTQERKVYFLLDKVEFFSVIYVWFIYDIIFTYCHSFLYHITISLFWERFYKKPC